MSRAIKTVLIAATIGAINAVVLKSFEFLVNEGGHWLWDDVFNTGVNRWGVVPLATVLGIGVSAVFVLLGEKRLVKPKLDPLEEEEPDMNPTLKSIGVIALIGLASLLAGASLGPEAPLMAVASALGIWFANRANQTPAAKLWMLASIGALLVAFLGSIVMVLIPVLMLWQKKQVKLQTLIPVVIAGSAAFGTLWLMDPSVAGYGDIPLDRHYAYIDYALALGAGVIASLLGWGLKRCIAGFYRLAQRLETKWHWAVSGAVFGLVIGGLYLIGGESIQFNGSAGSGLLINHEPAYGVAALLVILATKLVVTGWSLASGYRGGLVFPSVFMGVAVALIAQQLFSSSDAGVMLGSIAGIFGATTGAGVAMVFILGMIPIQLSVVALFGLAGAAVGKLAVNKLLPSIEL